MKYEILINDDVPKQKWNEFVKSNNRKNIFQTFDFYEIYKDTHNYKPVLIAVTSKNKIISGLLAYISTEFQLLKKLSSISVINGGPIFESSKQGEDSLKFLMNEYDKIVQKKVLLTQIRNIYPSNILNKRLNEYRYDFEPHLNFLINLDVNEDKIWSKISKSKRKGIKKNSKNIIVQESKDINAAYKLIRETYEGLGYPLVDKSHFLSTKNNLKKNLTIYYAIYKKKKVGCRLVLSYKNYLYDWYAGADNQYLNYNVNDILVWEILKRNLDIYSNFDFGGAGHPDKPYGVREFKRRFGGELVNYGRNIKYYSKINELLFIIGLKIYKVFKKLYNTVIK
jgi:serine/alanine adding enzyme